MGRRVYDGLISGQPVDTYVEKAAYPQPEQEKKKYQKSFHQSQLLPLSFPQVNPGKSKTLNTKSEILNNVKKRSVISSQRLANG